MKEKFLSIFKLFLIILFSLTIISCNLSTNDSNHNNDTEHGEQNMKFYIKVNGQILSVTPTNNSSTIAFMDKLKAGDVIVNMRDYGNFEKVGSLGFTLPTNDTIITTEPGDVILYQGNQITIYYDENTWSFTKLGKIDNIEQDSLKSILGKGNVTVIFTLAN